MKSRKLYRILAEVSYINNFFWKNTSASPLISGFGRGYKKWPQARNFQCKTFSRWNMLFWDPGSRSVTLQPACVSGLSASPGDRGEAGYWREISLPCELYVENLLHCFGDYFLVAGSTNNALGFLNVMVKMSWCRLWSLSLCSVPSKRQDNKTSVPYRCATSIHLK